jgi:hypothetical protein
LSGLASVTGFSFVLHAQARRREQGDTRGSLHASAKLFSTLAKLFNSLLKLGSFHENLDRLQGKIFHELSVNFTNFFPANPSRSEVDKDRLCG